MQNKAGKKPQKGKKKNTPVLTQVSKEGCLDVRDITKKIAQKILKKAKDDPVLIFTGEAVIITLAFFTIVVLITSAHWVMKLLGADTAPLAIFASVFEVVKGWGFLVIAIAESLAIIVIYMINRAVSLFEVLIRARAKIVDLLSLPINTSKKRKPKRKRCTKLRRKEPQA